MGARRGAQRSQQRHVDRRHSARIPVQPKSQAGYVTDSTSPGVAYLQVPSPPSLSTWPGKGRARLDSEMTDHRPLVLLFLVALLHQQRHAKEQSERPANLIWLRPGSSETALTLLRFASGLLQMNDAMRAKGGFAARHHEWGSRAGLLWQGRRGAHSSITYMKTAGPWLSSPPEEIDSSRTKTGSHPFHPTLHGMTGNFS